MVKRELLLRLKEGLYWIIPYEENPADYFPNWHLAAAAMARGTDFYIGYYSALTLHSLITQPSLQEQVVVAKQIKPSELKVNGVTFQFIYNNQQHFFGTKKVWIDSYHKVACSDLEKTFVDCLYKPDYGGGIVEITKALYKAKAQLDYGKLVDYCRQFGAQSVIKRLGFLLELLDAENPFLPQLQNLATKSIIPLEPSYEKKGPINTKWSLRQNIEMDELTSPIFS